MPTCLLDARAQARLKAKTFAREVETHFLAEKIPFILRVEFKNRRSFGFSLGKSGFKKFLLLLGVFLCGISTPALAQSDAEITQAIIEQSQVGYPGNCPCPYNTDRAGRSCGGCSAYSRAGGYSPLCYPKDVTLEMIEAYRRQHGSGQSTSTKPAE
jgi:hypothetical protein